MTQCSHFRMTNDTMLAHQRALTDANAARVAGDEQALIEAGRRLQTAATAFMPCVRDAEHEMPHRDVDGKEWTDAEPDPLETLRSLSEAATPGEWQQEFYRDGELMPDGTGGMDDHLTPGTGIYVIDESSVEGHCLTEFTTARPADAAFVVAAVNYVRSLL